MEKEEELGGDGGRTAGRRQAHTMVNGICDFPFLLLERATVFAIVGTCWTALWLFLLLLEYYCLGYFEMLALLPSDVYTEGLTDLPWNVALDTLWNWMITLSSSWMLLPMVGLSPMMKELSEAREWVWKLGYAGFTKMVWLELVKGFIRFMWLGLYSRDMAFLLVWGLSYVLWFSWQYVKALAGYDAGRDFWFVWDWCRFLIMFL